MEKIDLITGHVYEAKRKKECGDIFNPVWNDRQIVWIGPFLVQYDSPTVTNGRKYPTVSIDAFLKWAKRDVTEDMPKGDWRPSRV